MGYLNPPENTGQPGNLIVTGPATPRPSAPSAGGSGNGAADSTSYAPTVLAHNEVPKPDNTGPRTNGEGSQGLGVL